MKSVIAYFWPLTAYHDAGHGSLLERAAARRHNRQLASSLPIYIRRWAVCTALALVLQYTVPSGLAPLAAMPLIVSLCGLLQLVLVWLLLRRGPY